MKLIPSQDAPLRRIFGEDEAAVRRENDLYTLAAAAKPGAAPYIYVDCGIADGLVTANREVVAALHKSGRRLRVPRGRGRTHLGILGQEDSRFSAFADEENLELNSRQLATPNSQPPRIKSQLGVGNWELGVIP